MTDDERIAQVRAAKGSNVTGDERIAQLRATIDELKARLPKHSVPPAMIFELEELEDELKALKARKNREPNGRLP